MGDQSNLPDILAGFGGAIRQLLSRAPGLGEGLAGFDAYNRSRHERAMRQLAQMLGEKVDSLELLVSADGLHTDEGKIFARKVVDCALDAQLNDKQEYFANALINGIVDADTDFLTKLRFADILRHLSLAALTVLVDMHQMFKNQVRGVGTKSDPLGPIPQVAPIRIAEHLGTKYEPFLVMSAIAEMQSQGLFSTIAEWHRSEGGRVTASAGFATELAYTEFTYRFVEFILIREPPKRLT